MGCTQFKREFYTDIEYDEEREIRTFEEEMGAFKKTLNQVLPRISIEDEVIDQIQLEDFLKTEFSEHFSKLIQNVYFIKIIDGKKYYDVEKIKLLLFLLTKDTVVDNKNIKYHDKVKNSLN